MRGIGRDIAMVTFQDRCRCHPPRERGQRPPPRGAGPGAPVARGAQGRRPVAAMTSCLGDRAVAAAGLGAGSLAPRFSPPLLPSATRRSAGRGPPLRDEPGLCSSARFSKYRRNAEGTYGATSSRHQPLTVSSVTVVSSSSSSTSPRTPSQGVDRAERRPTAQLSGGRHGPRLRARGDKEAGLLLRSQATSLRGERDENGCTRTGGRHGRRRRALSASEPHE